MNPISQILWEAAADVERLTSIPEWQVAVCLGAGSPELAMCRLAVGDSTFLWWVFEQPRAVVAAAMRDAAFLAEWADPHLLGGSK